MSRARKLTPRYLKHKQSGRGRAVWTDADGQRQEQLLPGDHESAKSRQAFAWFLLERGATPRDANGVAAPFDRGRTCMLFRPIPRCAVLLPPRSSC